MPAQMPEIRSKEERAVKVSENVDAEFINNAVFKITKQLYQKNVMYKTGFLLLSGNEAELEKKIAFIDFLIGRIDLYVIKKEMRKALVYTALLKKKTNILLNEVNKKTISLPNMT